MSTPIKDTERIFFVLDNKITYLFEFSAHLKKLMLSNIPPGKPSFHPFDSEEAKLEFIKQFRLLCLIGTPEMKCPAPWLFDLIDQGYSLEEVLQATHMKKYYKQVERRTRSLASHS